VTFAPNTVALLRATVMPSAVVTATVANEVLADSSSSTTTCVAAVVSCPPAAGMILTRVA
jgi:hypothetical protein